MITPGGTTKTRSPRTTYAAAAVALAACCLAQPAWPQNVKITPVGSHPGELCDRATIFEDPTGVRMLYDAGHSVLGPEAAARLNPSER